MWPFRQRWPSAPSPKISSAPVFRLIPPEGDSAPKISTQNRKAKLPQHLPLCLWAAHSSLRAPGPLAFSPNPPVSPPWLSSSPRASIPPISLQHHTHFCSQTLPHREPLSSQGNPGRWDMDPGHCLPVLLNLDCMGLTGQALLKPQPRAPHPDRFNQSLQGGAGRASS